MRLTRKKAIELCIELWTYLAETGDYKFAWPDWDKYDIEPWADCWFCEYNNRQEGKSCQKCPLKGRGERRCIKKTPYGQWAGTNSRHLRKKYAKLFLAQIKELQK